VARIGLADRPGRGNPTDGIGTGTHHAWPNVGYSGIPPSAQIARSGLRRAVKSKKNIPPVAPALQIQLSRWPKKTCSNPYLFIS